MQLPSLPKTQNTIKLKDWPTTIKYKAFTAGQQSLLLQVVDPNTPISSKIDAIRQVFDECVDAGQPFSELPIGVVEMVFLKMRTTSVGETIKPKFSCQHKINDTTSDIIPDAEPQYCGQEIVIPIPLDKVDYEIPEGYQKVFDLGSGYSLSLKEPSYQLLGKLSTLDTNNPQMVPEILTHFIHGLTDAEGNVWELKDKDETGISKEEAEKRNADFMTFKQWVSDNIQTNVIQDIFELYFEKIPRIAYHTSYTCPKCKTKHDLSFKGLDEIFI